MESKITFLTTLIVMSLLVSGQFLVIVNGKNNVNSDLTSSSDIEKIVTDHFVVEYPEGADLMGERIAKAAEEIYNNVTSFMNYEPDFKTTIEANFGCGGTHARAEKIVLPATPYSRSDVFLKSLLTHEYTHVIQIELGWTIDGLRKGLIPHWLDEDMAEYVNSDPSSDAKRYNYYRLNEIVAEDEIISLKKVEVSGEGTNYTSYYEGYSALVYMESEFGEQAIENLVDGIDDWNLSKSLDENMDSILKQSVGLTYGEFDQRWMDWVKDHYDKGNPYDKTNYPSLLEKGLGAYFQPILTSWYNDTLIYEKIIRPSYKNNYLIANLYHRNINEDYGNKITKKSSMVMSEDGIFSNNRSKLIFVSYESRLPQIHKMNYSSELKTFLDEEKLTSSSMNFDPTCFDDEKIAFVSNRNGDYDIFSMDFNGSRTGNLIDSDNVDIDPSFSPDGKKLVFASNRDGDFDIYKYNIEKGETTQLTNTPKDEMDPTWSPKGEKIAYERHGKYKYSRSDVCLIDVDGGNIEPISGNNFTRHTSNPTWNHNGTKLAFSYGIYLVKYVNVSYEDEPDGDNNSSSIPGMEAMLLVLPVTITVSYCKIHNRYRND